MNAASRRGRVRGSCAVPCLCSTAGVVDALLTPAEIAERWHVRRARVYQLIRDRALPSVYLGRSVRVPQTPVEAFIAAGGWKRPADEEHAA